MLPCSALSVVPGRCPAGPWTARAQIESPHSFPFRVLCYVRSPRQMASRAIGELVRKLGERVLPSVIPILSLGLKNPNPSTRQVHNHTGLYSTEPYSPVQNCTIRTVRCRTVLYWAVLYSPASRLWLQAVCCGLREVVPLHLCLLGLHRISVPAMGLCLPCVVAVVAGRVLRAERGDVCSWEAAVGITHGPPHRHHPTGHLRPVRLSP